MRPGDRIADGTRAAGAARGTRRDFLGAAAGTLPLLAAPALVPSLAQAQATTYRMSSWLPGASTIPGNVLGPWMDQVRLATEGRVDIAFLDKPLGPPAAHIDLLRSGEADVAYSIHGYSGDAAFLRARFGQFSFLGDAYTASHGFSGVYTGQLDAVAEHEGIKLLGVFQHGPGALFLKEREVRTGADFAGLRIRTSGGYINQLLESLGAVPVPAPPAEVAAKLAAGEIDGVCFPYEGVPAFGIMDLVTFVSELEGGYYNASWFLGMSTGAWGRIAPEDQALVERISAETVHLLAAKAFYVGDYAARQQLQDKGVPIETAARGGDLWAVIEEKASGHEAAWSAAVSAQGYDAGAALASMRGRRHEASGANADPAVLKIRD